MNETPDQPTPEPAWRHVGTHAQGKPLLRLAPAGVPVCPGLLSKVHDSDVVGHDSVVTRHGLDASDNLSFRSDDSPGQWPIKRRTILPIVLFFLTCLSTFWVGVSLWNPNVLVPIAEAIESRSLVGFRQMLLAHWDSGLIYMACVMLILFLHEMGHFVATLHYRVPASYPFFLPFPANPIGTFGAVIGMQGALADRKQIFDIGIAGPLAGLVAAVPIAYFGVSQLDLSTPAYGGFGFRLPLLLDWFAKSTNVPGYETGDVVWMSQLNPMFVAGWVGMLITGLNMMPIGQLDGGHITYTMFGKFAHKIAQFCIVFAIAYMVYHNNYMLIIMVVLLLLMGPNHPPTRDDSVPLGPFRYVLGMTSLVIPILCFPPQVFKLTF